MRLPQIVQALILVSLIGLLAACGDGSDDAFPPPDSTADSSDGGDEAKADDSEDPDEAPEPGDVVTATIYPGASLYDGTYRVINSALSVLDVYGDPIDHLDGGDFEGRPDVDPEDTEGHHDAQKLDYGDQLSGWVTLMLDISDSMAEGYRFQELKDAAKRFVRQMAEFGLGVEVYAFDSDAYWVGSIPDGGDATSLDSRIDALVPGTPNTYFYDIIAARIDALISSERNSVNYPRTDPDGSPSARVGLLVVMSDGRDNSGASNEIEATKDNKFSVVSIAVGENPNMEVLEGISEFLFTVPEEGTYADAVDAAVTGLKNYYHGFYLVDYMPPVIEGTNESFEIKLVGNECTALRVTYDPDEAGFATLPPVPPYCCRVHAAPGSALDPTDLPRDASVEFRAVKLWTHDQPMFAWEFENSDGGMILERSVEDPSVVNVITNVTASSGTLTANEPDGWQSGPITVGVR